MLQQSAHPQHQRIGGAISAQARVQAQPRSRASSQASSIAAGSNARSRAALLAGLEVNTSAIKSEDDAKSEYSAASASQPAAVAIPPVGFPPRPAQYAKGRDRAMAKADIGNESASSTEARMPNFEPPAASLVYPGARPVDFNPWMGNGPEDVLSEQTVKSGFGNKPSITNESNTARPVIWGPLKHKSGLQTLSSLFVAILEKRQASGKLTASSTFKPPPRVSLTNTKREAWLSDLANPAAALRKFNRTIPYGITGKGLLEQCLAKEIPTARAVWLAKCIGTNELRTLRRKGLSGALGLSAELKWVREWTIHVEQFLEATIQTRPDGAWKEKVQYIIRLTYHFFAEQLLDQDHFLDWVMASFEASSLERLPLWLVHVQLYWRYLVSTRKRGRRLAEALCASLDNMEKDAKTNNVLAPVSQRLRLLLGTLAVSQTACLIMPKSWNKFEGIIKGLTNRGQIASAIAVVTERNVRLAKPLWEQNPKSTVSPKRRAFDLLDAAGLDASVPDMCTKLYDLLPHTEAVVKLVLEWCCSPYRQGIHRVYVTSRVLRRIGMSGADVETHLLSFLMDPPSSSIQITNIIKTVAELVRAKSFAVLKVLRAVIARGAMADSQQSSAAAQRLRQLVRGIPTMGLPQHVGDLQRNLLREAVSQPKNQADITMTLKQAVQRTVFSDGAHGIDTYEAELLKTLNTAQRFELSAFVRLEILRLSKNFFNPGVLPPSSVQQNLTAQVFMAARDILENLEDFPLLADVVGICLRQCNGEMLAAIADTLHANAKEFGAIGALRPLSTQAFERYHVFRMDMPIEKGYVKALIGLLNATKGDASLVQRLTYDLARCDQRNALSMCSPASDNNLDLAATSGLDTAEEVERILASGTTMDEQSISRVFQRLTSHLIRDYDTQSKAGTKGSWFERLRSFDESAFDMLVVEWMSDLLNVATADVGIYVITFLIGAGALSFPGVAAIDANLKQDNQMPSSMKHKLSVIMLSTLLFPAPSNRLGSLEDRYRFKLMQSDFAGEHVAAVLKQVGIALAIIDETVSSPDMESLFSILRSDVLRDFILRCAVEHRKPIQNHIMAALGGHATGTGVFRNIVEGMLETSTADTPSQEKIPRLVRTVGELSLPLCQLEMQLLLESTANSKVATSPPATNTSLLETASALFEAIMRSPDSERPPWIDLVDGLEPALLQRLRAIAEMQILKLVNEVCGHMKSDSISASIDGMQMLKIRALARRLLYVIDSTMTSHAPPTVPTSSTDTPGGSADAPSIDRFAPIRETLARHFVPDGSMRPTNRLSADLMCILLNALLHMLIVRKLALPTLPANNAADIASLLPVLLQIFPTSSVSTSKSTAEFLYDTAAYLSDDLADEARTTILKNEGSKYAYDPRVKFILGSPPDAVDKWLGLVTSNTVPSPTSGPISSSSAAATGLMGMAMAGTPSARFNPQTMPRPPNSRPSIAPPGLQRQQSGTLGNGGAISASGVAPLTAQNLKCFNAPVPFHLRRWELLPDQGTGAMGGMANDTAISLGLLGARRV